MGLTETTIYKIDELAYERESPIVGQNRPFLLKEILKFISFPKQLWVLFPVIEITTLHLKDLLQTR